MSEEKDMTNCTGHPVQRGVMNSRPPLSPAAQAVRNAAIAAEPGQTIAAALRAAADQDAPLWMGDSYQDGWCAALDKILAIAAELETK